MFVNQYAVCVAQSTSPHPGNASTDIGYPMSSGTGEALGPAPFGRGLHPSMSMASSSSTTVISRASPDHRLLEADSNHARDPEPEAATGVVPRPDCVSDPVRDPGPVPCPGHGLNPGVAPDHVPAPVPVSNPVSDLARERLTQRAPDWTPRPGQTAGTHGDSS